MVHIHGVKLPVIIHDYENNLEFSSSEGSQQAAVWRGGVLIIISRKRSARVWSHHCRQGYAECAYPVSPLGLLQGLRRFHDAGFNGGAVHAQFTIPDPLQ